MGQTFGRRDGRRIPTVDPENSGPSGVRNSESEEITKKGYFSGFFYLGKGYFRSVDPESYLFGNKEDLKFLPSQPSVFPYKRPSPNDPTGILRCNVNVQKDSVRLVRHGQSDCYHLEFTYDADVPCKVMLYEQLSCNIEMRDLVKSSDLVKSTFECPAGSGKVFNGDNYTLTTSDWNAAELTFSEENNSFPLVIVLETDCPDSHISKQYQMTIVSVEQSNASSVGYIAKIVKQKLFVDDLEYLLQDIYGIENKKMVDEEPDSNEDDFDEDTGAECIVCFTDTRDTVLLPCKHFCVCNTCASSLRYKASTCPICRAPFTAMLRMDAVVRVEERDDVDEEAMEFAGKRVIPLMTAINGYPEYHPEEEAANNQSAAAVENEGECETTEADNAEEMGEEQVEGDQDEEPVTLTASVTPTAVEVVLANEEEGKDDQQNPIVIGYPETSSSPIVLENSAVINLPGTPSEESEPVLVVEGLARSRGSSTSNSTSEQSASSTGSCAKLLHDHSS